MKPAAQPASSPPLPQLQTEPPSESQPDSAPARVSEARQSKWADMRRPSLVRLEETGAEAIAALNNITFDIHPDVGLQLATPWQTRDVAEDSGSEPFPFEITGPPEVVAFLKRNTDEGKGLGGYLSPPNPVTINGRAERKKAGIPLECSHYCFCYPLECLTGLYDKLVTAEGRCDPWLFFLLLGGYAYFDVTRKLLRTNSFVLTPAKASLMAIGPLSPNADAIDELRKLGRLKPVTLGPLSDVGFTQFAWANPQERPGGLALLPNGADPPGSGAFVYETDDRVMMLYALIAKDQDQSKLNAVVAAMARERASKSAVSDRSAAAHARFLESMGSIAKAAASTVDAARKLQGDLAVWRRGPVESWVRSHGISLTVYYVGGVGAYYAFEGWGPLDSIYYLTATATTNGDELQPQTAYGKLFSSFYILLGITIVFSGLSPLALFGIERIQAQYIEPLASALATWTDGALHAASSLAEQLVAVAPRLGPLAGCLESLGQLVKRKVAQVMDTPENNTIVRPPSPATKGNPAGKATLRRAQSGHFAAGGGGEKAEKADPSSRLAIISALRGYFIALMLVLAVGTLGVLLSAYVHGYTLIDALFWTVSCMTTAGGDLHADTSVLQALYIFYMPLAAVAALTAARMLVQTSFLRELRLDHYELKAHSLLHQESSLRGDPSLRMRENDFVIAVLRQRKLIDNETIDAIRSHFSSVVIKSGDGRPSQREGDKEYDPVIDAEVIFKHLVRQQRVRPISKKPAEVGDAAGPGSAASGGSGSVSDFAAGHFKLQETVYVDMSQPDEGYSEWFEKHWSPSVEPEDVAMALGGPVAAKEEQGAYKPLLDDNDVEA